MRYEYKVPTIMKINQVYYGNRLIRLDEFKKCLKPDSYVQELIRKRNLPLYREDVGPSFATNGAIPIDKDKIGIVDSIDTIIDGYIKVSTSDYFKDELEKYLEKGYKAGLLATANIEFIESMGAYSHIIDYCDLVIHGFEMIPPRIIESFNKVHISD